MAVRTNPTGSANAGIKILRGRQYAGDISLSAIASACFYVDL
jgi:hypothetical protein